MTAPIHAIPSPAQQKAAADLASLPVEMMSRTTTNMFSMQASFLFYGWLQSMQAGKAMADAIRARSETPQR
jgi:hypothetical protein